ncbi:hypothetical protein HDV03_004849 [Kappamyces sp. JEL0829]|nr:hypothetical protein HDV03_004849 [Kappamyces sp. JEL0829]
MAAAHSEIIIIGAGIAGLGLGMQLKRKLGCADFEIYEKGSGLGGTWFFNTYPGAACDIPSILYSYSFAQNPLWTTAWACQKEILQYLDKTAGDFDVKRHIVFNVVCASASWDPVSCRWHVALQDLETGRTFEKTCKIFVTATGVLSDPNNCPLPGKDEFHGAVFHSARWRHDVDVTGKNVVLIGNAQIVPEISKKAKRVSQFIRSPHHIDPIPMTSQPLSSFYKGMLYYFPFIMYFFRFLWLLVVDFDFTLFRESWLGRTWRSLHQAMSLWYIKSHAPQRYWDLLLPTFPYGSKRRVFGGEYLRALHRPNVELSNEPLAKIVSTGIVTKSGKTVEADVIVYATGFKTQSAPTPFPITGDDGITLAARWKKQGAAQAYLGGHVASCPNFVMLLGTNLYQGHHSVINTLENQLNHTIPYIRKLLDPACRIIKVTQAAESNYAAWINRNAEKLLWKHSPSEESGWYFDKDTGKTSVLYPNYQSWYWWDTLWVKWGDFQVVMAEQPCE